MEKRKLQVQMQNTFHYSTINNYLKEYLENLEKYEIYFTYLKSKRKKI